MAGEALAAIEAELRALEAPPGNFIRGLRVGRMLMLAGTGPAGPRAGKVGAEITTEEGRAAAREAGLRLLWVMREELGSLSRVGRVVQVRGFVNAVPTFEEHPYVIDGCSNLFIECFGEAGRHVRTSVGVSSLPNGIPVEIEAVVEVVE